MYMYVYIKGIIQKNADLAVKVTFVNISPKVVCKVISDIM